MGNGPRPRCEHLVINRVHLDLTFVRVRMLGCNCGVCVGVEYFNYACRRLPFLIFFAPYFCGKPCLTVQKMWNHPNLGHRGAFCPILTHSTSMMWFEPQQFWYTTLTNPLNTLTFICTMPIPFHLTVWYKML
jgi:hypothetical protein